MKIRRTLFRQSCVRAASLGLALAALAASIRADNTYFSLLPGTPLLQDWSNPALITINDDWSAVPSINGYRGDDPNVSLPVTDAQTVVSDYSGILDVNANQSLPDTFATVGVTEFAISNPVVALSGSGASDFPNLDIRLNTSGCLAPQNVIKVSYVLRDIEASSDNSVQQFALQYRVGPSGNYTNIPAGYVADATTGPGLATLMTPVSVQLPTAAQGQPQVHLRILTANAAGNDEWVGIDDINVSCQIRTAAAVAIAGRVTTRDGRGIAHARVQLLGSSSSAPRIALTNAFGYYSLPEVAVGDSYIVSVSSRGHRFPQPDQVIHLLDAIGDLDFVADE